jgi:preprotein translocase subunit SecA
MAWAQLQDKYPTRLDVPREEWDALGRRSTARRDEAKQGEACQARSAVCTSSAPSATNRDASTCSCAVVAVGRATPAAAASSLSLEDDLMRIFAGDWVKRDDGKLGMQGGEAIESRMVTRRIEAAQKKVEERNFEIRKNLLEYDEVMDEQRKRVYSYRQRILDGVSRDIVHDMIRDQAETNLATCLAPEFGPESFAKYAGKQLTVDLDPRLFKKTLPEEAIQICLDEAERQAETDILAQIDVCLAVGEEESEWNWGALAHFVNTRWNLGIRDKELKSVGRDRVDELLIDKARAAIRKIKIEGAEQMLDPDYGVNTAIAWVKAKFGIEIDADEIRDESVDVAVDLVNERALEKYDEKEAVYPVMAGMYQFVMPAEGGAQGRIDREGLIQWASRRFESELSLEDLKNKQRDEIREFLVNKSRDSQQQAQSAIQSLHGQISHLSPRVAGVPLANANGEATNR